MRDHTVLNEREGREKKKKKGTGIELKLHVYMLNGYIIGYCRIVARAERALINLLIRSG